MREDIKKEEIKYIHSELLLQLLMKIVGPIVLVFAGLALLALRLSGWSMIFGIPMVVIGVVLMIYSYDEVLSNKSGPHNHEKKLTDRMEE